VKNMLPVIGLPALVSIVAPSAFAGWDRDGDRDGRRRVEFREATAHGAPTPDIGAWLAPARCCDGPMAGALAPPPRGAICQHRRDDRGV
jgi:hypothetical protein